MVTTTNQGIKRKKTTETNFMEEFANMRDKDIMKKMIGYLLVLVYIQTIWRMYR